VRTISDIERGRTIPHRSTADRLAAALDSRDLAGESPRALVQVAGGEPTADRTSVPLLLPGGVRHFVGRTAELAMLTRSLNLAVRERPGLVVIWVIGGTPGVGKTALAVHWAHQVAPDFPDGQLYVNLRGYDPGQPLPAAGALAGFLRALGVAEPDLPPDADDRAARYRSLLAGRRMLVVLDNARSQEQVRPLLPGTSTCVVVVTSRDALPGLVARDGATRLDLDLLPLPDAIGLLRRLIGRRAKADPDATEELARRCSQLPLALRVAAERAAARPADSLSDLLAELDEQRQLDVLDAGGDPATAVRAVFSWSYRHLDAVTARAFRLIGLHPGPDLDRYGLAALTGSTAVQAGRLADQLVRAHLLHPVGRGRTELHDLLRAYARELALAQDSEDDRCAALTRLFDHYLQAAGVATGTEPGGAAAGAALALPALADPAAAQAWLDSNRASLVAAVAYAADRGWPGHAVRLAMTLARHLEKGGSLAEATTVHTCALRAARQAGDREAEASILSRLGIIGWRQARYPEAIGYQQQALALCREIADSTGEVRALGNLGLILAQQGRYRQATRHQRQALALCRQIGDRTREAHVLASLGELDARQSRYPEAIRQLRHALTVCRTAEDDTVRAYILITLGNVFQRQARYAQAARHYQQALALFRRLGARADEACALASLGEVDVRLGRYPQATRRLQRALTLFRAAGERANEAYALASLGDVDARQGRYPQAIGLLEQALGVLRQTGDRTGEAGVLNDLGQAFLACGRACDAVAHHEAAVSLAGQLGDDEQLARGQHGLGDACLGAGDPVRARQHWQEAVVLYGRLGAAEADQIRAVLEASA
jgi:tetratricopeptide (TPR) repeat protein